MPLDAESTSARAIRSRAVVHFEDVMADAHYQYKHTAEIGRWRGTLGVPMLRKTQVIGAIMVARTTPGRFSDQAVIAIENVRLFTELQASNRDLAEALQQQTATAEILRVISRSPTDAQPVFDEIAENAVRLCSGQFSAVFRFDGELIHFVAYNNFSSDALEAMRRIYPAAPHRAVTVGTRTILEQRVIQSSDIDGDPDVPAGTRTLGHVIGFRSIISVPMLREDVVVGMIQVGRPEIGAFTESEIALLQTFADQAVIAIENVRLFTELQEKNRALTEAHAQVTESLQQQTATSEILRVISQSPTHVQPVFDTIVASVRRLCGAFRAVVCTTDGERLYIRAVSSPPRDATTAALDESRRAAGLPLDRGLGLLPRAFIDNTLVHVPDVEAQGAVSEETLAAAHTIGWRSAVVAPMQRDGRAIFTEITPTDDGARHADRHQRHLARHQPFADGCPANLRCDRDERREAAARDRGRDVSARG